MKKAGFLGLAIALSVVFPIGLADTASAQQAKKKQPKLTLEQAWAKCTPYAQQIPEWNVQGRTARGKTCMLNYGYRI